MFGWAIAVIYFWIISYWITAVALAIYLAFLKENALQNNNVAYWIFYLFFPSIGYGLLMRNIDFYPNKTRVQSAAYYVFKYMAVVHFVHVSIWMLSWLLLLGIGSFDNMNWLFPALSFYAFLFLFGYVLVPLLISRLFFYTDFGPLSLENTELLDNSDDIMNPYRPVDMKEWQREIVIDL